MANKARIPDRSEMPNIESDGEGGVSAPSQVNTPQEQRKAATALKSSRQAAQLGSTAAGFTKYYGSRGHKALRRFGAVAQGFEEGKGAGRVATDVAVSEIKKKIVYGAIKKVGLANPVRALNTIKQAKGLAMELRRQAAEYTEGVYFVILAVAIVKDYVDIATVQLFSPVDWVIDLFIWVLLMVFLWGKGTWKVKAFIKIALFFEILPFAGMFPVWSICVIYAYFVESKRIEKAKIDAGEIENAVEGAEATLDAQEEDLIEEELAAEQA